MPFLILLTCISSNLQSCHLDSDINKEALQVGSSHVSIKTDQMKLKITVGEKIVSAILYDNPATRDFISQLPLTLTFTDYNSTEKISDLAKKLSIKDAPAGFKPSAGDITYYAPWGNLAVFYKNFSYSSGLISLGKITSGIDALHEDGTIEVKIELDK
jgi:hypothetical protein